MHAAGDYGDIVGFRNLSDVIDATIAANADRVFIRTPEKRNITWADFSAIRDGVAGELSTAGIGPGNRVVLQLRTVPETVVLLFALYRLGAVAVMVNLINTPRETLAVARRTGARVAVLGQGLAEVAAALKTSEEPVRVLTEGGPGWPSFSPGPAPAVTTLPGPDDPATTIFTSGTTAAPKAVTYTHGNHIFAGEIASRRTALTAGDTMLHHFPLYHMNGLGQLMSIVVSGATVLLAERFRSGSFDWQLDEFRPTVTNLNATHIKMIRETGSELSRASPLRTVGLGLRLSAEDYDWFEHKYGCRLRHGYGQTESVAACIAETAAGTPRGSCGLPMLGYAVRIVREDGSGCATNETGEIVVSCSSRHGLMRGYDDDTAATEAALRDGWLYTGDMAYRDEQGFVYWVDRSKDIIKRAGENISPKEIELLLEQHPDVLEAAVVGVPDRLREELPVAYVVLREGCDATRAPSELREFCGAQLAPFKVPADVRVLSEFPHTAVGKIEKRVLDRTPVQPA